jgi:hypothetical protein
VQETGLGAAPGAVVALSAKDGAIVGKSPLGGPGLGMVALDGNIAYSPAMSPLKPGAVLRVDLSTQETRELWRDSLGRFPLRLRVSPDHARLMFALGRSDDKPPAVLSVPVVGGPASTIFEADAGTNIAAWAWMPDGKSALIVCAMPRTGSEALSQWLIVPLLGGKPRLLGLQASTSYVSVHPDGRRIAYVTSGPYRPRQLWKLEGAFRESNATVGRKAPRI